MPTVPFDIDGAEVSLWSRGELLGRAVLATMAGPLSRERSWSGPFTPTERFARVWPVFQEWNRAGAEVVAGLQRMPPDTLPERFREELLTATNGATLQAMEQAQRAVAGLELELHDDSDQVVPAVVASVTAFDVLALADVSEDARAEAEAEHVGTRGYIMIVNARREASGRHDRPA
jgi:hypothetical protein